jgi:hypothetical protein
MTKRGEEKSKISKLKTEIQLLREEIRADISVPIIASFGFIIALVWRDAIQSAINEFLSRAGLLRNAYIYQFISAIIVTIIVVSIMLLAIRFKKKKTETDIKA